MIPQNIFNFQRLDELTSSLAADADSSTAAIQLAIASGDYTGRYRRLDVTDVEDGQLAVSVHNTRHLSSSSSGSSSGISASAHSSHGAHEVHSHAHDALIFLFLALVIGAAVIQINNIWPFLQQTVLLFVLGFLARFSSRASSGQMTLENS